MEQKKLENELKAMLEMASMQDKLELLFEIDLKMFKECFSEEFLMSEIKRPDGQYTTLDRVVKNVAAAKIQAVAKGQKDRKSVDLMRSGMQ